MPVPKVRTGTIRPTALEELVSSGQLNPRGRDEIQKNLAETKRMGTLTAQLTAE